MGNKLVTRARNVFGVPSKQKTRPALTDKTPPPAQVPTDRLEELVDHDTELSPVATDKKPTSEEHLHVANVDVVDILGNFTRVDSHKLRPTPEEADHMDQLKVCFMASGVINAFIIFVTVVSGILDFIKAIFTIHLSRSRSPT